MGGPGSSQVGTGEEEGIGVEAGDVLAGKYRVERVIGAGGMGVVVAARHLQLDDLVALKLLLPQALQSAEAVARFAREARAAVKIKGEHVARVLDVGELESGAPFMVMEYLEGRDLAAMVEKDGPLPIDLAVELVLQACVALAEAHALGIVHRDLKPANLFCVRGADGLPSVKVLDFGISKLTGAEGPAAPTSITKTQTTMGTPVYMSPEQMRSARDVDARADIWAMGVVLYELVAGHAPFQADTVMALTIKVYNEPPPSLRGLRPEAPPELERVILRCLEKDAAGRYPDVGELARALAPFAPKRALACVDRAEGIVRTATLPVDFVEPPPPSPAPSPSSTQMTASRTALSSTGPSTRRRGVRLATLGGAASLLVVASLAVGLLIGSRQTASRPVPASPALTGPPSSSMPTAENATPRPPPAPAPSAVTAAPPSTGDRVPSPPSLSAASAAHAPRPAPVLQVAPRKAPDCSPPYTVDAQGHRIPRPECL
jgi:serine/threonine-protein kinase